jgi:hypothetical protein
MAFHDRITSGLLNKPTGSILHGPPNVWTQIRVSVSVAPKEPLISKFPSQGGPVFNDVIGQFKIF